MNKDMIRFGVETMEGCPFPDLFRGGFRYDPTGFNDLETELEIGRLIKEAGGSLKKWRENAVSLSAPDRALIEETLKPNSDIFLDLEKKLFTEIGKAVKETYLKIFNVESPINDAIIRGDLCSAISHKVEEFKVSRLIYDYKVVCDESTNPSYAIDSGIPNVAVIVQPLITGKHLSIRMGNPKFTESVSGETLEYEYIS